MLEIAEVTAEPRFGEQSCSPKRWDQRGDDFVLAVHRERTGDARHASRALLVLIERRQPSTLRHFAEQLAQLLEFLVRERRQVSPRAFGPVLDRLLGFAPRAVA